VAVDGAGTVYVADTRNDTIRRITPAGVVTTFAGAAGNIGPTDGLGDAARFYEPNALATDGAGNVYVADTRNHTIRRITPAGAVTTLAGLAGASGSADGTGSDARFNNPYGLAVDTGGNVYVADTYNCTIRRITPAGAVTTLAGLAGSSGSADGTGSDARFFNPQGVAVDQAGNIYVADGNNHTFRRVTPGGIVTTLAGKGGADGSADGIGNSARFFYPTCVALDSSGIAYVTDSFNNTIRKGQLAQAPTTSSQLQNLAVAAGASVQFSVTATAVPAPTYQWYHDNVAFSGATASTLSFASARSSDAGTYSVVITNELGSATSNSATLTVTSAPVTPPAGGNGGGSSGGGGGGAPSPWFLVALLALTGLRRRFRPAGAAG
jgi:MYXO-CTERM domain-containing protein